MNIQIYNEKYNIPIFVTIYNKYVVAKFEYNQKQYEEKFDVVFTEESFVSDTYIVEMYVNLLIEKNMLWSNI